MEIIQALTAAGANVYTTDLRDMYAPEYEYAGPVLFEAVNSVGGYLGTYSSEAVSLEVIQALLAAAVVAEAPEGYLQVEEVWTPLHLAIFTETQEAIRVMLDDRADPNAPDPAGNTPFHFAAAYSPPEVVRAMLDAGADPNIPDRQGNTPFPFRSRRRPPGSGAGHAGRWRRRESGRLEH